MAIKPPANIAEAVVHSEIRAHLAAMNGSKINFLERHMSDPRVVSAVLGSPPFLSGLTHAEVAVAQKKKMAEFLAYPGPAILGALVEHEHVYPMVPAARAWTTWC